MLLLRASQVNKFPHIVHWGLGDQGQDYRGGWVERAILQIHGGWKKIPLTKDVVYPIIDHSCLPILL